jgi:bacillithiol biosynthesis cysteine-adding enzyme BshC
LISQSRGLGDVYKRQTLDRLKGKAIERPFFSEKRSILVSALQNQYKNSGLEIPHCLHYLLLENVVTVTTGHQLGIAGGPHFFLSKIAATINLAKQLGDHVFPVFWMASEDHDFQEIANTWLFGKYFSYQHEHEGGPVGRFLINHSLIQMVDSMKESLREGWMYDALSFAYQEGFTLAQATRRFVDFIFKDYNLIIIDGDDPDLKKQFYPLAKKEFEEKVVANNIDVANNKLIDLHFKPQVYNREVNLFKINDLSRIKIDASDADFYSLAPEEISPNALLRPIYQELILPNTAYVGGGAEVLYWAQLYPIFQRFDVPMPTVLLRPSVVYSDSKTWNMWQNRGWDWKHFFENEHDLKQLWLNKQELIISFDSEIQNLLIESQSAANKLKDIDPTLIPFLNSEVTKMQGMWLGIQKKAEKAIKQKYDVELNRISKNIQTVFPNGEFQERLVNASSLIKSKDQIIDLVTWLNPLNPEIHAFIL